MGAARGGAELLGAGLVSLAANYLFLLGAGRVLGSVDYGTIAALTGLLTVVLLPTSALQMAVSREVSRREALGESAEAAGFVRAILVLGLKVTLPLLAVAAALLVPLRELLNIDSTAPVALALAGLVGIFAYPVALGVLQGHQRFRALAFIGAAPMVARLAIFVVLLVLGLRLYGALVAMAITAVAAAIIALVAIRDRVPVRSAAVAPALKPFLRYLVPVVVGLLGISVLTNADILVVKARFAPDDAGIYAAASAFARVAFFLPATILAVLFPRTAARQARGEESEDILGRSLIVTAAFCALLTAGYALVGDPLVRITFGAEFAQSADLLVPFCIAMTLFSFTHVLLGYHLSRGESRFAWIVAGAVVVQLVLLATVPTSMREVLWTTTAVALALIGIHELVLGGSGPALRAGFRHFEVGIVLRRMWLRVRGIRFAVAEGALVVIGYSLVAVAATWPLALHLRHRLLGEFPNDGAGGAAWFEQLHEEGGYRLFGVTHHTLTGAPFGWDQGSALNFQWLLPYYPGYVAAGPLGGTAALNLVILAGFALSGGAMYLLVRWLGCGRLVAAWAGFVFLVFPWHTQRALAGHASLVHLEWFPLVLLAGLAWLRNPNDRRGALVGLAVACAWLTSGYFGAMSVIMLAGVAAVAVWQYRVEDGLPRALRRTTSLWAPTIVATAVVAVVSLAAGGTAGVRVERPTGDISDFGAHLRDYLPDPGNPVAGRLALDHLGRSTAGFPGAEGSLYPGLLTLVLAIVAIVLLIKRRLAVPGGQAIAAALVAVVALAVVLAAPNPMRVLGIELQPMPSRWVLELMPSFRVPARFIVVIMVALIPIAALGLTQILAGARRRARTPSRATLATIALGLAAIAISAIELPAKPDPMHDVGSTPAEYAAVAATPRGILAEYPLQEAASFENSRFVFWQRRHGRPLLNGAIQGTASGDVRSMLVDPHAPGAAADLAFLGVTAIVTRPRTYQWRGDSSAPDTPDYGQGYTLVRALPGGVRVWRVTARPADAIAAYSVDDIGEALPPEADGFVAYRLERRAQVGLYASTSATLDLRFVARASTPGRVHVAGDGDARMVRVAGETPVSILVHVPRGRSTLTLSLSSGGALSLSRPWFTRDVPSAGRVPLRPVLQSTDPGF